MNSNTIYVSVQTLAAINEILSTNSTNEINESIGATKMPSDNIQANDTSTPSTSPYKEIREYVVVWSIIDIVLFITIVCGNCLTIAAVQLSRRLRSVVSNLFILSLAISDLLVGLTIPYHLAFYLDVTLGLSKALCMMKFFFNIVACCVSIWNLIAIAVDRYIAIVYPLHYSRWITKRKAVIVIMFGWISGTVMGAIPLFWNHFDGSTECEFDEVLPPWYMAGIITPVFSLIWFCMLTLYWRIWREAYKHAKQLRASISGLHDGGGHSDWKSVQVNLIFRLYVWVLNVCGCVWLWGYMRAQKTSKKWTFEIKMENRLLASNTFCQNDQQYQNLVFPFRLFLFNPQMNLKWI